MAEAKKELTPEQIEQMREKKRQKRARQKANKAQNAPQPQEKTMSANNQKVRLTDEEYAKQQLEFKSKKIEMNPKDAIVSIAEASEAKTLAYSVNEVNAIAEYVRNNMGAKVPLDTGVMLIKIFQESVAKPIEEYIKLANSHGIGSRRGLALYRETQTKEKNKAAAQELFRNKTIENEIPEETKEREAHEKTLEKAVLELEKAKEALRKAEELKAEAQNVLNEGFAKRSSNQKERKRVEAEKAKEAARVAAEQAKAKTEEADTAA